MTAGENTQQFEEQLARRSRVVAFWSALGALLTLSSLVYSGVHLARVRQKTQEAEEHLKAKQAELSQADARLRQVNAQFTKAKQSAQVYERTLKPAFEKSHEEMTAAFKQAVSEVPGAAGITIQIAYKSQLEKAKEIAGQLRNLGYEVPPDQGIEIRGVHISEKTYLRYFFKSDEVVAEKIANQIKGMGVYVETFPLVGAEGLGEVHPRNFEFRLGRKYSPQETASSQ